MSVEVQFVMFSDRVRNTYLALFIDKTIYWILTQTKN